MYIPFLKYKKIFFSISGTLVILSLISFAVFGLNFGIDFTGGSILEVEFKTERPNLELIKDKLSEFNFKEQSLQLAGEKSLLIRVKQTNIDIGTQEKVIEKLKELDEIQEKSHGFESISPVIGGELKEKTKIVIILSLLAIILYIAFAFRRISRPVSSWQYGLAAVIALFHDVLIPLGIFSVLGVLKDVQVTIPVVTALLTIFGYSVNDTVVIFDRTRENLLKKIGLTYDDTVEVSLNQTLTRSINTSLTTLFVLFAIFFFGGETLKYFSLVLILGIICGTYSSMFLASPILVSWLKWREKRKVK